MPRNNDATERISRGKLAEATGASGDNRTTKTGHRGDGIHPSSNGNFQLAQLPLALHIR